MGTGLNPAHRKDTHRILERTTTNLDQLSMVNARDTIKAAYAALSGAQAEPTPLQVMGFAVLFYEVCSELHLDPGQMLDAARRVHRNATDHYSHELNALRMYINQELQ